MILISTVWHSGTHSLRNRFDDAEWIHCCEDAWQKAQEMETWTTYRDPHRIAASWVNRGRWGSEAWEKRWCSQWEWYWKIRDLATCIDVSELGIRLNGSDDSQGMHRMIDEGDLEAFYRVFPYEFIEYGRPQHH